MKKLSELINNIIRRPRQRAKIKKDYSFALHWKDFFYNNPNQNFEVIKRRYLYPEISCLVLPLSHPDGSFIYYSHLAKGLKNLLEIQYTGIDVIRSNPPDYVLGFISH